MSGASGSGGGGDLAGLAELERIAGTLTASLSAPERRRLLRRIGRDLRRSQAARIAAQQNPDGSAYTPRKSEGGAKAGAGKAAPGQARKRTGKLAAKRGAIRRGIMFRKLRQSGHLKSGVSGDELWVGFDSRDSHIARIHQEGDYDRPGKTARPVRYPRRILLGLTEGELGQVMDALMAHVGVG